MTIHLNHRPTQLCSSPALMHAVGPNLHPFTVGLCQIHARLLTLPCWSAPGTLVRRSRSRAAASICSRVMSVASASSCCMYRASTYLFSPVSSSTCSDVRDVQIQGSSQLLLKPRSSNTTHLAHERLCAAAICAVSTMRRGESAPRGPGQGRHRFVRRESRGAWRPVSRSVSRSATCRRPHHQRMSSC